MSRYRIRMATVFAAAAIAAACAAAEQDEERALPDTIPVTGTGADLPEGGLMPSESRPISPESRPISPESRPTAPETRPTGSQPY
jgi:hypothetical protein